MEAPMILTRKQPSRSFSRDNLDSSGERNLMAEEEMPRSVSQFELSQSQRSNSPPNFGRSTSMYNFDDSSSPKPIRVHSIRSSDTSPRNQSPRSQTGSPRSRNASPRGSKITKVPSGKISPAPGRKSPNDKSPNDRSPNSGGEDSTEKKKWSERNTPGGVVDESEGVNSLMFDSISSYDRGTLPHSTSIDNLNWDDVVYKK
jgi:hypothetical protein